MPSRISYWNYWHKSVSQDLLFDATDSTNSTTLGLNPRWLQWSSILVCDDRAGNRRSEWLLKVRKWAKIQTWVVFLTQEQSENMDETCYGEKDNDQSWKRALLYVAFGKDDCGLTLGADETTEELWGSPRFGRIFRSLQPRNRFADRFRTRFWRLGLLQKMISIRLH